MRSDQDEYTKFPIRRYQLQGSLYESKGILLALQDALSIFSLPMGREILDWMSKSIDRSAILPKGENRLNLLEEILYLNPWSHDALIGIMKWDSAWDEHVSWINSMMERLLRQLMYEYDNKLFLEQALHRCIVNQPTLKATHCITGLSKELPIAGVFDSRNSMITQTMMREFQEYKMCAQFDLEAIYTTQEN